MSINEITVDFALGGQCHERLFAAYAPPRGDNSCLLILASTNTRNELQAEKRSEFWTHTPKRTSSIRNCPLKQTSWGHFRFLNPLLGEVYGGVREDWRWGGTGREEMGGNQSEGCLV